MVKNQTLAAIGEEIGFELGQQMVLDYQASNQNDVHFYEIGGTSWIRFLHNQDAQVSGSTMPITKPERRLLFTLD